MSCRKDWSVVDVMRKHDVRSRGFLVLGGDFLYVFCLESVDVLGGDTLVDWMAIC